MSIDIKEIEEIKKVDKPWGYEKWIAEGGPDFKYVLKEILFKSKFKSSIQFHEFKEETSYVQKGSGILYYYPEPINIEEWKNDSEYRKILDNYINDNDFDKYKIKLLTGLIYLNMAALHHKPFNFALISYGVSIIRDVLNEKKYAK